MNRMNENMPVVIKEEGVKKFLEDKDIQVRIQQIKETAEYKNMDKLLEHPIIKLAMEKGSDDTKKFLQNINKTYEQDLLINVVANALKWAFEKFISEGGNVDINAEIRDFITTENVITVNTMFIEDIANSVANSYIVNAIFCLACDMGEESKTPSEES